MARAQIMDYFLVIFIFIIVSSLLLDSSHGIRIAGGKNGDSSVFNVLDYGAVGDGNQDDSQAFLKAWTQVCNSVNGDIPTLTVPQGKTFLLQSTSFKGPCKSTNIHVEIEGHIVAPSNIDEWGECEANAWLQFAYVDNLLLDGQGVIDGRGSIWWNKVPNDLHNHATINQEANSCNRPVALNLLNCNGFQLKGLTHKDSPRAHIAIDGTKDSIISNINIIAPEDSPNTDGIDISSTSDLQILHSSIGTGDDCIAIGTDTQRINITDIACGPGHGISIGSLGENGAEAKVEEIHVKNCSFTKTQNGARIKTWEGGSGYARQITYDDIIFTEVYNPIIIDQFYCDNHRCGNGESAVEVSHVRFNGFEGTSAGVAAITLNCSQSVPCSHIVLQSVGITPAKPGIDVTSFCENAVDVQVGSVEPPVKCTNNN